MIGIINIYLKILEVVSKFIIICNCIKIVETCKFACKSIYSILKFGYAYNY